MLHMRNPSCTWPQQDSFIVCNIKYGLPGTVLPAYCTAAGKLFLSQLDDETLETWEHSHNLVPYTANTIIGPDGLLNQIHQQRAWVWHCHQ